MASSPITSPAAPAVTIRNDTSSKLDPTPPRRRPNRSAKGDGPQLLRITANARLSDLEPPHSDAPPSRHLYYDDERAPRLTPYPIPWRHMHEFACRPFLPSVAKHISHCAQDDAEWVLVINFYRGSGALFDGFQGWLMARDQSPRLVVAKFCDVLELYDDEREKAMAEIETEARLYNTALLPLQGVSVPLFYGVFEVTKDAGPDCSDEEMHMFVTILEDCGEQATPDDEKYSFAFMSDLDKSALRDIVNDLHQRGVVHNDITPRNVTRRRAYPGKENVGPNDLCLIDFGAATLGTDDEFAKETDTVDAAINLPVIPYYY